MPPYQAGPGRSGGVLLMDRDHLPGREAGPRLLRTLVAGIDDLWDPAVDYHVDRMAGGPSSEVTPAALELRSSATGPPTKRPPTPPNTTTRKIAV